MQNFLLALSLTFCFSNLVLANWQKKEEFEQRPYYEEKQSQEEQIQDIKKEDKDFLNWRRRNNDNDKDHDRRFNRKNHNRRAEREERKLDQEQRRREKERLKQLKKENELLEEQKKLRENLYKNQIDLSKQLTKRKSWKDKFKFNSKKNQNPFILYP